MTNSFTFFILNNVKKQNPQRRTLYLQIILKILSVKSKLKPTTKLQISCTQIDLSYFALFFEKVTIFKLLVSDTPVTPHKTVNTYSQIQGQNGTIILHYW